MYGLIAVTPVAPGHGAPCIACGAADTWRVGDHYGVVICPACIEAKNALVPGREREFEVKFVCHDCGKWLYLDLDTWQRAYQRESCLDCR